MYDDTYLHPKEQQAVDERGVLIVLGNEAEAGAIGENEWSLRRDDVELPQPEWLRPNPPAEEAHLAYPHFYPLSSGEEPEE